MEFNEIASFFLVCVWLVPFGFFISMSANDNTLPYGIISSSGEEVTADGDTREFLITGSRDKSLMIWDIIERGENDEDE